MELNYPVTEDNKYYTLLNFLTYIKPFSLLNKRELQIYGELLKYYNHYKDLTHRERNKLVFDYDVRQRIMDKFETSQAVIYNTTSSLKKKKLIDDDGLVESYTKFINMDNMYLRINFKPTE